MVIQKNKGITLIALIVTIIVLLILSGVSVSVLTGENGILKRVAEATEATENAIIEEQKKLAQYEATLNLENTQYTDSEGNTAIIPAGFAVSQISGEQNISTGLVITDADGNEFVWIPIGEVKKSDGTTATIELNRYTFDSNGTINESSSILYIYTEEDTSDETTLLNYGNTIAKNMSEFKSSVETNGGYYIGRYEARTAVARSSSSDTLTKLSEICTDYVYNYITQPQSVELCRNMYNSSYFTSDLINSYAWDTATLFLQTFGTNSTYSRQTGIYSSISITGTNNMSITDMQCNIYDLAGNCREWSTETYTGVSGPYVYRGGSLSSSSAYTCYRDARAENISVNWISFRPILYF